jgi:pyruvate-ferredoxin/flavodoxin oxidoreductase
VPATVTSDRDGPRSRGAPSFVKQVTAVPMAGDGDLLPVSAHLSTAPSHRHALRSAPSRKILIWDPAVCIDCGGAYCPHATIRMKVLVRICRRARGFLSKPFRSATRGHLTIQVAPMTARPRRVSTSARPERDRDRTRRSTWNRRRPPRRGTTLGPFSRSRNSIAICCPMTR